MIFLAVVLAYLIGSVSFAVIVSWLMHLEDPRTYGSENPGATNVLRSGNKKAAALTLIGDLCKGAVVIELANIVFKHNIEAPTIIAIMGVAVVIGHIYPVFLKFHGGKGVATSAGVMLGFSPYLALCVIATWIIVFKLSKVSSLAAVVTTVFAPVFAYLIFRNTPYFGATLIIAFFVLYKHRSNIIRLLAGTEDKIK